MMKSYLLLITILCSALIFSCHKDLLDESQLVGKWKCIKIEEQGEIPPLQTIIFEFNTDSTYHYYGNNKDRGQKGTWYTLEDKLYTTPEGGQKMAVLLGLSGQDTVRFNQNKGGKPVTWTMVRQE